MVSPLQGEASCCYYSQGVALGSFVFAPLGRQTNKPLLHSAKMLQGQFRCRVLGPRQS